MTKAAAATATATVLDKTMYCLCVRTDVPSVLLLYHKRRDRVQELS